MSASASPQGVVRRFPLWLRIVLITFALLVVVGLAAPYFRDVDHYRTLIETTVAKQTGREVTIGKIRAKFLPSAGFVVNDVHMGNPAGFPKGDFLSVESVNGSLAWGPLFHKEIQINSIEIVKPKLTILTDSRGRTNYDFTTAGEGTSAAKRGQKDGEAGGGGSSFSLESIGKIALSDASMSMGQVRGRGQIEPTGELTGLNFELTNLSLDATAMKRVAGEANL